MASTKSWATSTDTTPTPNHTPNSKNINFDLFNLFSNKTAYMAKSLSRQFRLVQQRNSSHFGQRLANPMLLYELAQVSQLLINFNYNQKAAYRLMLRSLYKALYKFAFFRKHFDNPKQKLIKLFQCQQVKIELSNALNILPNYFSQSLVQDFSSSQTFLNYCQKNIQRWGEDGGSFQNYFRSQKLLRVVRSSEIVCLEAYMHWLLNYCPSFHLHQNNYTLELLNLNNPEKWFKNITEDPKRLFVYHHGPTNSGKSTSAVQELKRLAKNQKGIYMAPLRLLAWQYQQKLGNCSLITGQEKQYKNSNLISCTIEAAPLNDEYQVAVIDQIQMIADEERGWAWTRAVLAIKAKRIHLCGDERALNIISKILEQTGDILEERMYSRLSKLTLIHKKFKLQNISQGDCVINFSMNALINHRNDINRHLNQLHKYQANKSQQSRQLGQQKQEEGEVKLKNYAAIIYGKLPPQCRKSQAACFNSGKLPYLVATNAIGMGLNLNIKKIIFLSVERPTNAGSQLLQEHQIQQIAGRAGRGKQTGYVQCANSFVLKKVEKALEKVNETYGIQLQNLKDAQSNESDNVAEEEKQEQSSHLYNPFLKRFMRDKQCQIRGACFYFQTQYIVTFKLFFEQLLKRKCTTTQILHYMQTYCKIGNLYFFQKKKSEEYLMNLLEDKISDQEELFYFYNGLGLSLPNYSTSRKIRQFLQYCHHQYVDSFVCSRKVALPAMIVKLYDQGFMGYRYMDQVNELQLYFNLIETYVWLWGKFQFAFYQIRLAKLIKKVLSHKINQILQNNEFQTKIIPQNSFKVYQRNRHPKLRSKQPNNENQANQANQAQKIGSIQAVDDDKKQKKTQKPQLRKQARSKNGDKLEQKEGEGGVKKESKWIKSLTITNKLSN